MPIYEYQCKHCKYHMEIMQSMSEASLTLCPKCGQNALTRLISATNFHLKGSGWYATDFKDKPKGKAKIDDSPTAASKKPKTKPDNQ